MNIITLAWKNIIKNPLNLTLSVILFGLGVGLITFILLLDAQLKDKFDKNLADIDLVVGAKGSRLQMILCNMYHIDNPTGNIQIKKAAPLLKDLHPLIKKAIPLSLGDNFKSYRIVGTNHDFVDLYTGKIEEGKLWENDFEVTIGRSVADETGLKIGDKFVSSHGFEDDEDLAHDHASFKVVGILLPTGSVLDQLILTNTATVWLVHDHPEEEVSATPEPKKITNENHAHQNHNDDHAHDGENIAVEKEHSVNDHGSDEHDHSGHDHSSHDHNQHNNTNEDLITHHLDQEITAVLIQYKNKINFQALNFGRNIDENTDMQAASPAIEINRVYSMIGLGTDVIKSIAILIALVSCLSIFISLFKSMKSRKYELAILRVLGASRKKVFALIILEGIILAFIGYLFGLVISHLGMEILANYLKADFRYSFTGMTFLKEEILIFIVAIFLGVLAAFIPATQAGNADINKTLSEK